MSEKAGSKYAYERRTLGKEPRRSREHREIGSRVRRASGASAGLPASPCEASSLVVPSPAFCFLGRRSLAKVDFSVISGFPVVQGARLRGRSCCAVLDPSIVRNTTCTQEILLFLPEMQIFLPASLHLLNTCDSTGPVLPCPDFAFQCVAKKSFSRGRLGLTPKAPVVESITHCSRPDQA